MLQFKRLNLSFYCRKIKKKKRNSCNPPLTIHFIFTPQMTERNLILVPWFSRQLLQPGTFWSIWLVVPRKPVESSPNTSLGKAPLRWALKDRQATLKPITKPYSSCPATICHLKHRRPSSNRQAGTILSTPKASVHDDRCFYPYHFSLGRLSLNSARPSS